MRIRHRLASLPPHEERVDHLANNGPRPDDSHLYHNVVEMRGMQARQARHLCSALDLKHADRVGLLQRAINHRIVGGQQGKIDIFFIVLTNERERVFERGHHT
jgi:hypothetical protein